MYLCIRNETYGAEQILSAKGSGIVRIPGVLLPEDFGAWLEDASDALVFRLRILFTQVGSLQEALSEYEQAITGSRSDNLPGNPHRHHLHHELPGQGDVSGQRL